MKKTKALTKDEANLLLYFDVRAVDHRGRIDPKQMNDDDHEIMNRWIQSGFIQGGRIASDYGPGLWVKLSDEAWAMIAAIRKARAESMWVKRDWMTTDEKRALR